MHEMYLRHPEFTYSAFGLFTKNKERIQKSKETEDSRYIYPNKLDKACFQHDMDYEDDMNMDFSGGAIKSKTMSNQ